MMSEALKNIHPFRKIETPPWLSKLFYAIDNLDFSEGSGIDVIHDSIIMQFGQDRITGLENTKTYFKKIYAVFITQHFIYDVYQVGNAYFMYGGASIKSYDKDAQEINVPILFNILWLDENNKIKRYIVDYPAEMEMPEKIK